MNNLSVLLTGCFVSISFGVILLLLIWNPTSFGNRCSKAGFEKAEHEACVIRLYRGGTVYLENMENGYGQ